MIHKEQLNIFVSNFRKWLSDNYSKEDIERNFYDDAGYPYWTEIENYFANLLENKDFPQLDNQDKENLLYLIARNWDIGRMISWLSKGKQLSNLGELKDDEFINLANILVTLKSSEFDDAKIQFVSAFEKFDSLTPDIESLLLRFYEDNDLDIKGRALLSLGKLKYTKILELLEELWQVDEEHNKIKCLSLIDECLKDSDLMMKYLNDVKTTNQEYLSEYTKQLKRKYEI
jgi:hypothetical protein